VKFINSIKQSIKSLGLINYVLYVFNRILNKLSFNKIRIIKYYFFAQPVPIDPIIKTIKKRNIKVHEILRDDFIVRQFPRPAKVIEERFNQQARCFTAIKNDNEFIGYIWICENEYLEDEVRCNFIPYPEKDAVWDFDVYITPENRLSLAFPLLWDYTNKVLNNKQYSWTISRISAFNPVSLSVHKKMGARIVGSAIFFCFGNVQLLISSIRPFISISLIAIPQLKVNIPEED